MLCFYVNYNIWCVYGENSNWYFVWVVWDGLRKLLYFCCFGLFYKMDRGICFFRYGSGDYCLNYYGISYC